MTDHCKVCVYIVQFWSVIKTENNNKQKQNKRKKERKKEKKKRHMSRPQRERVKSDNLILVF